jgi:DNA-binding response OmpR family regulator
MARVLLAEANRRIGDFLAGILVEFGHEVTLCADASEADARLAATAIDVVLTDAVLDDADGFFSRTWRARGIPTITLTGRPVAAGRPDPAPSPPLMDKPFRFTDLQIVLDAVAACERNNRPQRSALERAA